MNESPALFGISVAFGLAAWGAVAWHYIWPVLKERPSPENLKPILLLHGFRFLGLAFVVPGVVSPELPAAFAQPVAYGDLMAAMLALLALTTLGTRTGTVLTWVFNAFGTADLIFAFYLGSRISLPDYARFVGRRLFYPDRLRASSSHNPWPGVSHVGANESRRAGTKQTKWRLMSRWFGI
jgi:hypothetical protein